MTILNLIILGITLLQKILSGLKGNSAATKVTAEVEAALVSLRNAATYAADPTLTELESLRTTPRW